MTVAIVLLTALAGIFAPILAPHDPYEADIMNKFAGFRRSIRLEQIILGDAFFPE